MIWEYRVIETNNFNQKKYSVHVCYYESEDSRTVSCVSERPLALTGRSVIGMLTEIELVLAAFDKPTLRIPELDKS